MKNYFFALFSFFFIFSCKKNTPSTSVNWVVISQNLKYQKDKDYFNLKSGKFSFKIENKDLPLKKIILLNSSLLGYFEALNAENLIVGVSSPEYIFNEKIRNLVKSGEIKNVGDEQKYDIEKIISLKPDAIVTNYVPNFENTYELLRKNHIKILFFDEYLEQNPLEKSAYIKVFGQLLGKQKESENVFETVKNNYETLIKMAAKINNKPNVLANEMYGNQWFLPGGKSNFAQLITDANAHYIFGNNDESKAIPLSFEEVFVKSKNADYWVNVGNHLGKNELLQINASYAKMKVFKNGEMYSITGKIRGQSNDYFESGVVRADLVLKDYIKIFHPKLFPKYQLTYMKKLR